MLTNNKNKYKQVSVAIKVNEKNLKLKTHGLKVNNYLAITKKVNPDFSFSNSFYVLTHLPTGCKITNKNEKRENIYKTWEKIKVLDIDWKSKESAISSLNFKKFKKIVH